MNKNDIFAYWRLIIPVAIMIASLVIGLILEKQGIKLLSRLVQRTEGVEGQQIILKSFKHLIVIWSLIAGLYICFYGPLIEFYLGRLNLNYYPYLTIVRKVLTAILLGSITVAIARLANGLINFYRNRGNFPVSPVFDWLTRLVIYSLGVISIVNLAGFSIDEIYKFILPFVIVIGSFVLGFIFEQKGLNLLQNYASRSRWEGDGLIVQALKNLSVFWFILAGSFIASNIFPFPNSVKVLITKSIIVCFLASVSLFVYRLAISFIRFYSSRGDNTATLTSLFENITKLIVFSLGFLIILQSIGIGITPLITALGIGGVSIGLALKGPLENLTSGITIITSKKVRPGDYIKLSTGEEGYVTDVELRYTVIKRITGNLQVIPNAHLISSSFTNYGLPDKKILVPIELGVSYDSDLEKVEVITLEVAQELIEEIMKVSQGTSEYKAFLCYKRFSYYSIDFTVFLQVEDYFEQLIIRHKFIKKIYKRYQQENIIIPFPIQESYLDLQSPKNQQNSDWDQVKLDDQPF